MSKVLITLRDARFKLFLLSQILLLFSALIFPPDLYKNTVGPVLFVLNVLSGLAFIITWKRKIIIITIVGLLFLIVVLQQVFHISSEILTYVEFVLFFVFYAAVTSEIIQQVWNASKVGADVIFGLMSGYISIGVLGFLICSSIEFAHPGSYMGLDSSEWNYRLLYYSFITLLTIGYGDITPATDLSETAAVLIGLGGQMYLVIFTAVIVGKYTSQKMR